MLQAQVRSNSLIQEFLICLGLSITLGLFSKIVIFLPFTPVPIIVQNTMVLAIAALMGRRRALISLALFFTQGVMGFPVFAGGGFGLAYFMGPTGGYLLGYFVAAYLTGSLMDKMQDRRPLKVFYVMGLGNLMIYLFGALHLSMMIGLSQAIILGVLPFIIGDLLKLLVFQGFIFFGQIKSY